LEPPYATPPPGPICERRREGEVGGGRKGGEPFLSSILPPPLVERELARRIRSFYMLLTGWDCEQAASTAITD